MYDGARDIGVMSKRGREDVIDTDGAKKKRSDGDIRKYYESRKEGWRPTERQWAAPKPTEGKKLVEQVTELGRQRQQQIAARTAGAAAAAEKKRQEWAQGAAVGGKTQGRKEQKATGRRKWAWWTRWQRQQAEFHSAEGEHLGRSRYGAQQGDRKRQREARRRSEQVLVH